MKFFGLVLGMLVCSLPLSARAFSDPALYAKSSLEGGGDGRFFTGSPADSYTCAVCHTGGQPPAISIQGLPLDGYKPGKTYDVVVSWTDPKTSHALTLEIVNAAGEPAGTLALPKAADVDADGRCDQASDADVAAYVMKEGKRQIVGVTDCHPAALSFRFTAPEDPQVTLYLAAVLSDSSATPQGDGVSALSQALWRSGTVPPTAAASTCQTARGLRTGAGSWSLTWMALLWSVSRLRGMRGRSRRQLEP